MTTYAGAGGESGRGGLGGNGGGTGGLGGRGGSGVKPGGLGGGTRGGSVGGKDGGGAGRWVVHIVWTALASRSTVLMLAWVPGAVWYSTSTSATPSIMRRRTTRTFIRMSSGSRPHRAASEARSVGRSRKTPPSDASGSSPRSWAWKIRWLIMPGGSGGGEGGTGGFSGGDGGTGGREGGVGGMLGEGGGGCGGVITFIVAVREVLLGSESEAATAAAKPVRLATGAVTSGTTVSVLAIAVTATLSSAADDTMKAPAVSEAAIASIVAGSCATSASLVRSMWRVMLDVWSLRRERRPVWAEGEEALTMLS